MAVQDQQQWLLSRYLKDPTPEHRNAVVAANLPLVWKVARRESERSGHSFEDLEVWEPFSRNGQVDLAEPGWAWRVAQADLQDVRDADALLAIVNGTPPDEGVMLELGAAIALGKPVFLYRDDFRRCSDSEDYPLNLMVFSGLPQEGWQDWLYGSIEELQSSEKALVRWLKDFRSSGT